MKTSTLDTIVFGLIASGWLSAASPLVAMEPILAREERPKVQIALLLDTSSSMNGLIDQAKTQLWQIVNEFIRARQDGKAPRVEVALYEYGHSSLPAEAGYIRQVSGLSADLDRLSEALFALRTSGGSEYCGWVIRDAVRDLAWDPSATVYKAVFIAGNEPFTQGAVPYADACKQAIERGIVVNTIHCGDEAAGISGEWNRGAQLADGRFMTIDTNARIAHVDAPQDKEIAEVNTQLNRTYLPYGALGREGLARQNVQDANAAAVPGAPTVQAERARTKASANYDNSAWDALDGFRTGKLDLAKAKDEDLPEELRGLDAEGRRKALEKRQEERAALQQKLQELTAARDQFVAGQRESEAGESRLDEAVISAVRDQAAKKAFVFGKP
jgi:hypothetical protein